MEVLSRSATSSLNPDAPLFVPWAYQAVEDFSKEWWDLIQSSAWFRDYWLEERFDEEADAVEEMKEVADVVDLDDELAVLGEEDAFLPDMATDLCGLEGKYFLPPSACFFFCLTGANGKDNDCREVVSLAGLKWKESRNGGEKVKKVVAEKAPKIVNVKPSPRLIHQPR
ncbi:EARLY RESPONSIVE TO DEHYDRATION 15 protein [Nymphaea thermarum]|nr:EARLY RESPONSIVE TO DEHYDRATION 15 protein [Nymphaea thermarum]